MRLNLEFRRNREEVLAHEVGSTQGTSRGYPRGRTLCHRLSSVASARRVSIVQEDRLLFTMGAETLDAQLGQIIVVPPETPHKFVNIGAGPLRQIDIHASMRFITEWLEE